jgi:putative transposase
MSGPQAKVVEVTPRQREILQDLMLRRSTAQGLAQRVQIILEAVAGCSKSEQARRLGVDWRTVSLWRERWLLNAPRLQAAEQEKEGRDLEGVVLEVLQDAPRPGAPGKFSAEQVAQLIAVACEPPSESQREVSHWTPVVLADEMKKRKIIDSISPRQVGRPLKGGPTQAPPEPVLAHLQAR